MNTVSNEEDGFENIDSNYFSEEKRIKVRVRLGRMYLSFAVRGGVISTPLSGQGAGMAGGGQG